MCSFAVGIYNYWNQFASPNDNIYFILKQGNFSNRNGKTFTGECQVNQYPELIWYTGSHFAKVTSYNADGTPKIIQSKWGDAEVIESIGYDVFSTGTPYGSPMKFYH